MGCTLYSGGTAYDVRVTSFWPILSSFWRQKGHFKVFLLLLCSTWVFCFAYLRLHTRSGSTVIPTARSWSLITSSPMTNAFFFKPISWRCLATALAGCTTSFWNRIPCSNGGERRWAVASVFSNSQSAYLCDWKPKLFKLFLRRKHRIIGHEHHFLAGGPQPFYTL